MIDAAAPSKRVKELPFPQQTFLWFPPSNSCFVSSSLVSFLIPPSPEAFLLTSAIFCMSSPGEDSAEGEGEEGSGPRESRTGKYDGRNI